MPELSKKWLNDTTLRVMTYKSGAFTFQIGADIDCLTPMLDRINDAQARFNKIPHPAQHHWSIGGKAVGKPRPCTRRETPTLTLNLAKKLQIALNAHHFIPFFLKRHIVISHSLCETWCYWRD